MRSFDWKTVTLSVLFSLTGIVLAQPPVGGGGLISNAVTEAQLNGPGILTRIEFEGATSTNALRFEADAVMTNAWDCKIEFPILGSVATNDVLLVAFQARTLSSEDEYGYGYIRVVAEAQSTHKSILEKTVKVGDQWKQYYVAAKSKTSLSMEELDLSFQVGAPFQTLEIAEIQFLNYRQTKTVEELPQTIITYHGQQADADWRAPAAERINQIRKGAVELIIRNADGTPVQNQTLSIEMIRHQFAFGTAIALNTFKNNETYREKAFELFNEIVFENSMKWGIFERSDQAYLSELIDLFNEKEIKVRGHNVIWPSYKWSPDYIEDIGTNASALRAELDERIDRAVNFSKGRLVDWDVVNEAYTNHDLMDILGDQEMAYWFNRTRQLDPTAKLYINDYNILTAGGTDVAHQDGYFANIQQINKDGGMIEGIGMQGHFFDDNFTPVAKVYSILDRFATFGTDIKITEHDISVTQRDVQAEYTRDFMTICFSHPSVQGFFIWGFWEGRHWKPDGAIYDRDWNLRPHGQAWIDLVHKTWWTPEQQLSTGPQGSAAFEGFLGTYAYTIGSGEEAQTGTFNIEYSHQGGLTNTVKLILD